VKNEKTKKNQLQWCKTKHECRNAFNKKKAFEINNYRPVAISNCFSQIFERIILKLSPNLLKSEENQFGFKMGLSTYQPLFLVKETISKYKRSKTPCYVESLDAEKAFDSLWRNGLFFKLIDKIDSIFWFLLFDYYSQSDGLISLSESQKSDIFKINSQDVFLKFKILIIRST